MIEYKKMSYERFDECINILVERLESYIENKNIKIDYICPIIRSGSVPAVYISNKLNVVKFSPLQIKHITYKNGDETIETILNSLEFLSVKKKQPIFLIVDALQSTGRSVEIAIEEIKKVYSDAKILYVCLAKKYGSNMFEGIIDYFDYVFEYNEDQFGVEECRKLNIDFYAPVFPWENEIDQITHPDDAEENIFF